MVARPERVENDPRDAELRHALGRITERGGRILRVIYNHESIPWRIVTAYFDRRGDAKVMRMYFDEKADALYLRLDESGIAESEEVQPGVVLDFNSRGQVVGVEILGVKERVPLANLKQLYFEVA